MTFLVIVISGGDNVEMISVVPFVESLVPELLLKAVMSDEHSSIRSYYFSVILPYIYIFFFLGNL